MISTLVLPTGLLYAGLLLLWLWIALEDLRTRQVSLAALLLNIVMGLAVGALVQQQHWLDLGIGAVISYGIGDLLYKGGRQYALWQRQRLALDVPTPFGKADVWVLCGLGATFGVLGGLQACLLGLLIGGVVALCKWCLTANKRQRWRVTFAYTPSLLIAGCITLWQGPALIIWLMGG